MQTQRTHRKRPTVAKGWQLAVLKNHLSESENPAEETLLAAVAETGLDEKWVRSWFTRQRSKVAVRSTQGKLATEPRQRRAQIPTLKLDLRIPPAPGTASTFIDPTPCSSMKSLSPPSPVNAKPEWPRLARPTELTPRSCQSISAPMHFNNPSMNTAPFSHTTPIPTYSRDPLCNRYPDFSQFFLPRGQDRPPIFELPTPIDDHNQVAQSLAIPIINPYTPMQLFGLSNPPQAQSSFPAFLGPCPVAFSVRLIDLLNHI